jgi:hypothetical protein
MSAAAAKDKTAPKLRDGQFSFSDDQPPPPAPVTSPAGATTKKPEQGAADDMSECHREVSRSDDDEAEGDHKNEARDVTKRDTRRNKLDALERMEREELEMTRKLAECRQARVDAERAARAAAASAAKKAAEVPPTKARTMWKLLNIIHVVWAIALVFIGWGNKSTTMSFVLAMNCTGLAMVIFFTWYWLRPSINDYERCAHLRKTRPRSALPLHSELKYLHVAFSAFADTVILLCGMGNLFLFTMFLCMTALTVGDIGPLWDNITHDAQAQFIILSVIFGSLSIVLMVATYLVSRWLKSAFEQLIGRADPTYRLRDLEAASVEADAADKESAVAVSAVPSPVGLSSIELVLSPSAAAGTASNAVSPSAPKV